MQIFGLSIVRAKKAMPAALASVNDGRGGWWPIVRESFAGAWQQNVDIQLDNVMTFAALYACVTLIASDIGKLRIKLMQSDADGIWSETDSPSFSPVLRKPNRYQNRIKFLEQWISSKLIWGNTYALKSRDARNVVSELYVLDPQRVRPLVAPDGEVFYELKTDWLCGLEQSQVVVPAREIIHDVMIPLYHPLVGVSPISACGLAAVQGLKIQGNSTLFFGNGSQPGGVLTAPGAISQPTADRLKAYFDTNFSGANVGKVAVLGDGLKYEPMRVNAVDSQLIEQLKWTAENVCSAFHVPPFMVGIGPPPAYNNIEALSVQYYTQCLQNPIESLELCLDEGLELPKPYGTELDLDGLMRMDTPTKVKAAADSIGSGGMSPNEARRKYFDLGPVKGGNTPYMQQQNYSLAALERRDNAAPPPPTPPLVPPPALLPPTPNADDPPGDDQDPAKKQLDLDLFEMALRAERIEAIA
jgi:HK97 family phage portal protein